MLKLMLGPSIEFGLLFSTLDNSVVAYSNGLTFLILTIPFVIEINLMSELFFVN